MNDSDEGCEGGQLDLREDKTNQVEINMQNAAITGYPMCSLCKWGKPPGERTSDALCKLIFYAGGLSYLF